MKILLQFILLLFLIFPITVKSQQTTQPDSLLNKLTGNWVLQGTIAGQETTHDVVAKRVLNGQYVQLIEVSREKDINGNPLYESIVYICWQEEKKQYFCLWLDNTSNEGISNQVIGRAKQNEDKIEMVFKFSEANQFYTTFLYHRDTDTWQWLMDGEENGKLQPFARVKLTKNLIINQEIHSK
jgi:hypothetical protein